MCIRDSFVANVDQQPLVGVVHEINVAAKDFTCLKVEFDDAGEDWFFDEHIYLAVEESPAIILRDKVLWQTPKTNQIGGID